MKYETDKMKLLEIRLPIAWLRQACTSYNKYSQRTPLSAGMIIPYPLNHHAKSPASEATVATALLFSWVS